MSRNFGNAQDANCPVVSNVAGISTDIPQPQKVPKVRVVRGSAMIMAVSTRLRCRFQVEVGIIEAVPVNDLLLLDWCMSLIVMTKRSASRS
jgi:hypothetical protein